MVMIMDTDRRGVNGLPTWKRGNHHPPENLSESGDSDMSLRHDAPEELIYHDIRTDIRFAKENAERRAG
jgi:hypothetical protein